MIGSPDIDKHIRRVISPLLRENGFSKVMMRNNWAYRDTCIWIFNIRAVGNYFSQVTGFPPMSLTAWLGVLYTFIPAQAEIKTDRDGLLLPQEYLGHMRSALRNYDHRLQVRSGLTNPAEVKRDDIWWIDPDGGNIGPMVDDLAASLNDRAPLVSRHDRSGTGLFRGGKGPRLLCQVQDGHVSFKRAWQGRGIQEV